MMNLDGQTDQLRQERFLTLAPAEEWRDRSTLEGLTAEAADRRIIPRKLDQTRSDHPWGIMESPGAEASITEAQRLRALGAMVNGIAHDFNNSLWTILGYSQLLHKLCGAHPVAPEFTEYVDSIVKASLEAVETIARLNDYQQAVAGSEPFAPLALNAVIGRAIGFTRPRWEAECQGRGTPVEIFSDFTNIQAVNGSAADLCELFVQLIFNAVEAMPQGGKITVQTRMVGGEIVVSFADTGVGMTQEVRRRCLEPFYSTKGERRSGVGLAVVQGTLERHGGTMKIDTAPWRGARFVLTFPTARRHTVPPEPAPCLRPLRILAVDDQSMQAELLVQALSGDRHVVATARNAQEAIERFDAEHFDLVITDKAMPGMSGDQLAAAIKSREPGTPVIMLTGLRRTDDEDEVVSEFVDLLVAKPATLKDLQAAISKVMN